MKTKTFIMAATMLFSVATMAQDARYTVIFAKMANIREAPSTTANIVEKVSSGTVLKVLSKDNGWIKVQLPVSNTIAYLSASVSQGPLMQGGDYGESWYQNFIAGNEEEWTFGCWFGKKVVLYSPTKVKGDYIVFRENVKVNWKDVSTRYLRAKKGEWYFVLTDVCKADGTMVKPLEKQMLCYPDPEGFGMNGNYYFCNWDSNMD